MDKAQFRQTIISTGAVGALIGSVPVIALLAFGSVHSHTSAQSRSLIAMALDLGLIFFGSIGFCILLFGLLPMVVQHGFVWAVRRWTGRA